MFCVSNMRVNNRDDGLQPDNTYNTHANKEKIVHVDKLKLKAKWGAEKPTPHNRQRSYAGDPYSLEAEKKRAGWYRIRTK